MRRTGIQLCREDLRQQRATAILGERVENRGQGSHVDTPATTPRLPVQLHEIKPGNSEPTHSLKVVARVAVGVKVRVG